MSTFHYQACLPVPVERVAFFHKDGSVLKKLTPPPVFVQIVHMEPLSENSTTQLRFWFGPIPVRWVAQHSQVDPLHGFIDTQVQGPLKKWVHQHSYKAAGIHKTILDELIEYEHNPGVMGWFTRLIYNRWSLRFLFFYRRVVIIRETGGQQMGI